METPTQTLHRLTSYSPGRDWDEPADDPRIVRDLEVNDIGRLPWFTKRYEGELPRTPLPRDLPRTTAPTIAVLAGIVDVGPAELDLSQLARLLHLCAGVVRTTVRPYTTWLFRAAGSAGARFPMEIYVCIPEGTPRLPAGVHWFDPPAHAFVRVGAAPEGDAVTIVVTGVPWRTGWRYRERGFRHVYWDTGTMLSQLLPAADSVGLRPQLFTRFPDAGVGELVGADGIHEWPVAVIALGGRSPTLSATGRAAVGAVDAAPVEFPLVTAAQHAGDADDLGEPWPRGEPVREVSDDSPPVETVVLSRGSQRLMDPAGELSREFVRTSMAVAMRGIGLPHFVVANNVTGLPRGVYRWPDLGTPRRAEDLRDELYRIALDQGLARDASFVAIGASDVAALDDRGYREAQLAAGLVEGRLHLAAYALGASASGMTFLDSEMQRLLGEPLDGLLFTCVGVPEYRSTPGGPPGAPVGIRTVTPRE